MEKHIAGLLDLTETLKNNPPAGLYAPDQPYRMSLSFDSIESWKTAVEQYQAKILYSNEQGDGMYAAQLEFAKPADSPYAFAGAELTLTYIANWEPTND